MAEAIEVVIQALFVPAAFCIVVFLVSILRIIAQIARKKPGAFSFTGLTELRGEIEHVQSRANGDSPTSQPYRHMQLAHKSAAWLFLAMIVLFIVRLFLGASA